MIARLYTIRNVFAPTSFSSGISYVPNGAVSRSSLEVLVTIGSVDSEKIFSQDFSNGINSD